jgi:hypothetical protein
MYECDNCGRRYPATNKLKHVFPDIPDLLQRLDVGGPVPAGECTRCGALVYRKPDPIRLLVVIDGGLVQQVLADKPGVEAAVLDQDIEGADESDIVEVVGHSDRLRGTLQAHETVVAPVLIESAYRAAA